MIKFLQFNNPWLEATNRLCHALNVTIVDYTNTENDQSAWLGTGANGRVFRLTNGQVIKVVLGARSNEVEEEYLMMLKCCQSADMKSLVCPVVEGSYRIGEIGQTLYAAYYLLAQEGQRVPHPVSNENMANLAEILYRLHSQNLIHGDPRIQSVLVVEGSLRWIDFRLTDMVTTKINRKRDVTILYESLGGVLLDAAEDIEMYVKEPSSERLLRVLLKSMKGT